MIVGGGVCLGSLFSTLLGVVCGRCLCVYMAWPLIPWI